MSRYTASSATSTCNVFCILFATVTYTSSVAYEESGAHRARERVHAHMPLFTRDRWRDMKDRDGGGKGKRGASDSRRERER